MCLLTFAHEDLGEGLAEPPLVLTPLRTRPQEKGSQGGPAVPPANLSSRYFPFGKRRPSGSPVSRGSGAPRRAHSRTALPAGDNSPGPRARAQQLRDGRGPWRVPGPSGGGARAPAGGADPGAPLGEREARGSQRGRWAAPRREGARGGGAPGTLRASDGSPLSSQREPRRVLAWTAPVGVAFGNPVAEAIREPHREQHAKQPETSSTAQAGPCRVAS